MNSTSCKRTGPGLRASRRESEPCSGQLCGEGPSAAMTWAGSFPFLNPNILFQGLEQQAAWRGTGERRTRKPTQHRARTQEASSTMAAASPWTHIIPHSRDRLPSQHREAKAPHPVLQGDTQSEHGAWGPLLPPERDPSAAPVPT